MDWISAGQLDTWGRSEASRENFPRMIADLIRATADHITDFRVPWGESSQVRGYDGSVTSEGAEPWVPAGESIWEFGSSSEDVGPRAKFDKDYKSKTKAIPEARRKSLTLVLASARRWNDAKKPLADWIAEQRAKGDWKDVKAFDGIAMAHWLSEAPGVAAKFARQLGVVPPGVRSVDQFWDEYSRRFETPLTEDVLLCDRENQADALVDRLIGGAGPISLAADSPEEVIAFAVAAIRRADPVKREYLDARTLVVDTEQAARELTRSNLVLLPRAGARNLASSLAQYGPTLCAVGGDQPQRTTEQLARATGHRMTEALKTMGLDEHKAALVARASGRSVTILARTFPANPLAPKPNWHAQGQALIPALLAGGWDALKPADIQVVGSLVADGSITSLESALRGLKRMDDPPIEFIGSVWKMRAPVDAFVQLGYLIGPEDLDRFRAAATTVLSRIDAPPSPDALFRPDPDADSRFSTWLRDGLTTTLLQIAVLSEQAGLQIPGTTPKAWVDSVVAELPGLTDDHRLIASLRAELPLLMEAAPDPLLGALERLLEGGKLAPLFVEEEGLLSPSSDHVSLLFALETLAWDPAYLVRICILLARLDGIDPGGRMGNRPFNSLREILVAWAPSTYADSALRLAAIDAVLRSAPATGWRLLLALLPAHHDVSSPTQKPRFREAGSSVKPSLTNRDVAEMFQAVIDRVVTGAENDPARLGDLVDRLDRFDPDSRARAVVLIEAYLATASEGDREPLWTKIRDLRNRHRKFVGAAWAMPAEALDDLSRLVDAYGPADVEDRIAWLFDDWFPDIPGNDDDDEGVIQAARENALAPLLDRPNAPHLLLELASGVRLPWSVAQAAVPRLSDVAQALPFVQAALGSDVAGALDFAAAFSAMARTRFEAVWGDALPVIIATAGVPIDRSVVLVLNWPDEPETWDYVEGLGGDFDAEYWARKRPWPLKGDEASVLRAAGRYVDAGRASAALEATSSRLDILPSPVVLKLLDATLDEINRAAQPVDQMFGYRVGKVFDALDNRADVSLDDIARREYAYLPLLQHSRRALAIHGLMATSPDFYLSVLREVFPTKAGETADAADNDPSDEAAAERRKARVSAAYTLLSEFKRLPGLDGTTVDLEALRSWVEAVRAGAESDRREVTDIYIGHILAHAPPDPDGAWPHRSVRDLLEGLNAPGVSQGLLTERFNMRGVFSRGLFEGGDQERAFARTYRDWARIAAGSPKTARLLEAIAADWDQRAEYVDIRAEQQKMLS